MVTPKSEVQSAGLILGDFVCRCGVLESGSSHLSVMVAHDQDTLADKTAGRTPLIVSLCSVLLSRT